MNNFIKRIGSILILSWALPVLAQPSWSPQQATGAPDTPRSQGPTNGMGGL